MLQHKTGRPQRSSGAVMMPTEARRLFGVLSGTPITQHSRRLSSWAS